MVNKLQKGWNYAVNLSKGGLKRFHRPPIIIGGCGRSGTTLLLSILSAHPHIFAVPKETGLLCPHVYFRDPLPEDEPRYGDFYNHLLAYKIPDSCTRWCEKTPKNVRFFPQFLDHFGHAVRLIHLIRDGRDVVLSKHPSDPGRPWVTPERWVGDVSAGLEYLDHPQVLTLKYEELVVNLKPELLKLQEFLAEDFSGMEESWHENTSVRQTRAWFREVSKTNTKSIGKWKLPENQASTEAFMDNPQARELLGKLNYL